MKRVILLTLAFSAIAFAATPEYSIEAIRYATVKDFPLNGLVIGAPADQKTDRRVEKQEKPAKPSNKKAQPPAREKPGERNGPDPADQDHPKKPKE